MPTLVDNSGIQGIHILKKTSVLLGVAYDIVAALLHGSNDTASTILHSMFKRQLKTFLFERTFTT